MQRFQAEALGKFVLVRCRDAGVHAGVLQEFEGRACHLSQARRLYYWRPANGAAFLSGVATEGLDPDSRISVPVGSILLTEDCEITICTEAAAKSIREFPAYRPPEDED